MISAHDDAAYFREAARLNREDPLRRGSLLQFPDYGQLVMTGDIHGHTRNFRKLKAYADLRNAPMRHILLHEIIHEEPSQPGGQDMSHQLMLEAARWKIEAPDQIHFLQSNHELSQLTGKEISKGGRVVTHDFSRGMAVTYGQHADMILSALCEYIESFPLAARTANRVFLSHSLPNVRDLPGFDPTVVHRQLLPEDLHDGGHAYQLVWGRNHTPALLAQLARAFDVDVFICGHQPQENGFDILHDRLIILASDHNHGAFLPFDLKKPQTCQSLAKLIRPLAAIR